MRFFIYLCLLSAIAGCSKQLTLEEAEQLDKKRDFDAAAAAYTPYAEKGDFRAQVYLGRYYLKNDRDLNKAAAYFKQAADQGEIDSLYYLGNAYIAGKGVPQNADIGEQYLQKAAKGGSAKAMLSLGFIYEKKAQKTWQAQDFRQAVYWLEKAYESGEPAGAVFAQGIYVHSAIGNGVLSAAWHGAYRLTQPDLSVDEAFKGLNQSQTFNAMAKAYAIYGTFGKTKPPVTYMDALRAAP